MNTLTSYASSAIALSSGIVFLDNYHTFLGDALLETPRKYVFLGTAAALAAYNFTTPYTLINAIAYVSMYTGLSVWGLRWIDWFRSSPLHASPPRMDSTRIVDISADSRGFSINLRAGQITPDNVKRIFQRMDQWLNQLGIENTYDDNSPVNIELADLTNRTLSIRSSDGGPMWNHDSSNGEFLLNETSIWSILPDSETLRYSLYWSRTHGKPRRFIQSYNHATPLQLNEAHQGESNIKALILSHLSRIRSLLRWLCARQNFRIMNDLFPPHPNLPRLEHCRLKKAKYPITNRPVDGVFTR